MDGTASWSSSMVVSTARETHPGEARNDNAALLGAAMTSSIAELMVKPKRQLTAYNIFFQQERKRLLKEIPDKNPEGEASRKRKNRSTKRPHGKIGFAELGRTIAAKWRNLPASEKEIYTKLAARDKIRHAMETKIWEETHGTQPGGSQGSHSAESQSIEEPSSSFLPITSTSTSSSMIGIKQNTGNCEAAPIRERLGTTPSHTLRDIPMSGTITPCTEFRTTHMLQPAATTSKGAPTPFLCQQQGQDREFFQQEQEVVLHCQPPPSINHPTTTRTRSNSSNSSNIAAGRGSSNNCLLFHRGDPTNTCGGGGGNSGSSSSLLLPPDAQPRPIISLNKVIQEQGPLPHLHHLGEEGKIGGAAAMSSCKPPWSLHPTAVIMTPSLSSPLHRQAASTAPRRGLHEFLLDQRLLSVLSKELGRHQGCEEEVIQAFRTVG